MTPSYEEFVSLSKKGNLISVYEEILMDFETPVSFFSRLKKNRYCFLLESVEGSERWGRYSFLGTRPEIVFKAWGNRVEIAEKSAKKSVVTNRPLDVLQNLLKRYRLVNSVPDLPFVGGALGYVGYDAVEGFHPVRVPREEALKTPDIFFIFVQTFVSFDNLKQTIRIVDNVFIEGEKTLRHAYDQASKRIQNLLDTLKKTPGLVGPRQLITPRKAREYRSNVTRNGFYKMVRKAKNYIEAGDVIQVVLSQRLEMETTARPFEIYRALRFTNPSPYMFYLELEDLRIIGSSPEILVRLTDGVIELRPIAGTRPRGASPAAEKALEEDLLSDPKERAEHIMLVDLGRNDVGRVAEIGSVRVDKLMFIEHYSHVMHIVSNIRGQLAKECSPLDLFVSCFPAGTVSGAPKIRAMQIISELEPQKRGLYAGAVGYLSLNGNLDTCIVIRTVVMQGKRLIIQAGAGIVADSDPRKEYQETLNKAQGMLKAIELAEAWGNGKPKT